jgi:hypothetical protein
VCWNGFYADILSLFSNATIEKVFEVIFIRLW